MISVGDTWFHLPDSASPLAQGDQLCGVSFLEPMIDVGGAPTAIRLELDIILLTQSCDLEQGKVDTVLVAPTFPVSDWIEVNPSDLDRLEEIRKGYDMSLYLLPAWPSSPIAPNRVDRIVDFAQVRSLPFNTVKAAADERVGLRSPAREHFAQAIARSFMRVGLPIDIPSFALRGRSTQITLKELDGEALMKELKVQQMTKSRAATEDTYILLRAEQSGRGTTP